jgi:16S rRNA (uracil1498-N3)-methyltransferase
MPRIFIDSELAAGAAAPLTAGQLHYLAHVMRTDKFLAFNGGTEYLAAVGNKSAGILEATEHKDPGEKWTFCFAPVKKIEELISGVVQMGAGVLQPVITERTVVRRVNWERMRRVIIENCEQSGRNSVPELRPPIAFAELDKKGVIYGDERQSGTAPSKSAPEYKSDMTLLVGPEGGFSDAEFAALDKAGATGVSLGATILRAEVAAVALCAVCAGPRAA